MKLREQLDTLRTLERLHREALQYMVLGRVTWTEPKMVAIHSGWDRKEQIRVGIVDCGEPMLIVHHMDALAVTVCRPQDIEWPWPAVEAFPKLAAFLDRLTEQKQSA
jgi:hypothetical protein